MQNRTIYPVIMCGGSGTRLWPLSLKKAPKQYHTLTSDKTMLQETILRMQDTGPCTVAAPSIICAKDHANIIATQAKSISVEPLHIILEPIGRNTAPVAAIAAKIINNYDPNGLILLLPADHYIEDIAEFWRCVQHGAQSASQDNIVTLGLHPTTPHTGYGYIRKGKSLASSIYDVDKFVEKPDVQTAQTYLDSGDYFWNAGIFLFSAQTMLDSFQAHAPEILNACMNTLKASHWMGKTLALDKNSFANCPSNSIDYAILEHANNITLVAPVNVGWNDIGSWQALDDFAKENLSETHVTEGDNVEIGDTLLLDCKNNYVRSDGPLITGVGLENLIIIATKDSILILPKDRGQDVKNIVETLKQNGRTTKL